MRLTGLSNSLTGVPMKLKHSALLHARSGAAVAALATVAGLAPLASPAAAAPLARGAAPGRAAAADCPWVHSSAPASVKAAQVLGRMTLADKIALLHGASGPYVGNISAQPQLCIPAIGFEDGPAGVADGMYGVTQLPAPVAAASSWDTQLMRSYGQVIGSEERGKGAAVNLGPMADIVRDPRWGRAYETFGEDPYLNGQLAAAEIRGVQSQGVLSEAKHLAAYNQETNRNTPADDVIVSGRALQEIYLPAYHAATSQGHAASVMCGYAMVNGQFSCQNPYLLSQLERNWGFAGFVTSDWGATHSTVPSAQAGLDVEMPDDTYYGTALQQAVTDGQVSLATLDGMVTRVLTELFRFNLFADPPSGSPAAVVTSPAHAAVARSVSEQGTVLLKNTGHVLPLSTASGNSIAVIGSDAGFWAETAGEGSANVNAPYVVTPYQGISQRAGHGTTVTYTQGSLGQDGELPAVPTDVLTPASGTGHGLTGQYYNNTTLSGPAVLTRVDPGIADTWSMSSESVSPGPGVDGSDFSAQWTGTLTPPKSGTYTFSLTCNAGCRMYVGGQEIINNWSEHYRVTVNGTAALTAAKPVPIEVQYYSQSGGDMAYLGWTLPGESLTAEAAQAAAHAKVAIVFASSFETEGSDNADIDLHNNQNQVIAAVAKANPDTIVVLNTGSAVTMPWANEVKGILEAWYPGQEDGNAIAAILFGDTDPSGHLPVTFPVSLADVPAHTPAQWPGTDGTVQYSEGLDVGYRWYESRDITPLYAFGYGLSYTTFKFSDLRISPSRGHVTVTTCITNTGPRAGADIAQLYLGDPATAGEPPRQLKGFSRISLQPGQTAQVRFTLTTQSMSIWDHGWAVAPGRYRVMVGDSSTNLPQSGSFTMPSARS